MTISKNSTTPTAATTKSTREAIKAAGNIGRHSGKKGRNLLLQTFCKLHPPSGHSEEYFQAFWLGVAQTMSRESEEETLQMICYDLPYEFLIPPWAAPTVIAAHREAFLPGFCCPALSRPPTDHELRCIWDGMMGYFNEWHLMWAMLNLVPLGARPGWSVEDYLLQMLSSVLKTSVTKRAAYKILSYAFWEPMENKTKIYRALSSLNLPKAPMHKLKELARGRAGQDGAVEFSAFVEWVESQQRPLRPSSSPELILDAGLKLG